MDEKINFYKSHLLSEGKNKSTVENLFKGSRAVLRVCQIPFTEETLLNEDTKKIVEEYTKAAASENHSASTIKTNRNKFIQLVREYREYKGAYQAPTRQIAAPVDISIPSLSKPASTVLTKDNSPLSFQYKGITFKRTTETPEECAKIIIMALLTILEENSSLKKALKELI